MSQIDLYQSTPDALAIANRDDLISRYQRLRAVGRDLNNRLVKKLSMDALHEGGRKIGILQGDTLVFDTEDETSVLMEYCLHDVRRNGRNAIEQYLIDSPPDPDSDGMTYFRGMQHPIYSLFVVESVESGLGVILRDLLSQKVFLVVDIGFGSSARPGLVLATRLLPHDGFFITGGAALPIGLLPGDQLDTLANYFAAAIRPDENGYFDPAPIIRACLKRGCASQVQYQEPSGRPIRQQRIQNTNGFNPLGRNSPCPCGSGKKWKQCCMNNR